MFRRLRFKLTILYAGLFCLALAFISITAYVVVRESAGDMVRDELVDTANVFDRVWQLRFQRLEDGATESARDTAFAQALATGDGSLIGPALGSVRRHLEADTAFVVTPQGTIVTERGTSTVAPALLQEALEHQDKPTGVLMAGGMPHQAVSAPIYGPNLLGWMIVAERLDAAEMQALERLSSIPLDASAFARSDTGSWVSGEGGAVHDRELTAFVGHALEKPGSKPGIVDGDGGAVLALVRPFRSLDGTSSALLLRYPMSSAMAPYQTLFGSLLAICFLSMCLVLVGGWMIARSITRPLSELEASARRLQEGEHVPVVVGSRDEIFRLAETFNAMAATIQARERRITHLALHDPETRLPNRRALERKLASLQRRRPVAVAAIGIDRFTHMRGAIGYAHASSLISRLGERLERLAPHAPMALLSTDVLGVVLQAKDEADARARIQVLLENLEHPLSVDEQDVDVSITIGVAIPQHGDQGARELVERASIALDQAREAHAKIGFFDEAAYGDPTRNLSLMGDMRRALANGEMCLYYQPKLDMRTNRIDGVEALVRWIHPRRGMIAPDLFVPMAEETGHVRALTEWVLGRALEEQGALARAGYPLAMSVNISGRLLSERDFAQAAIATVANAQQDFCFEITETAVIDNPELALENIDLFVQRGVKISIDDYGSGLSSLAYLKQLRAHELKIDKMFIQGLTSTQREALLVRSTIELAHSLGMRVTAEGVENPTAFSLLAAMGCDMAQGFFVGRPMPVNELLAMLNHARRNESQQRQTPRKVSG